MPTTNDDIFCAIALRTAQFLGTKLASALDDIEGETGEDLFVDVARTIYTDMVDTLASVNALLVAKKTFSENINPLSQDKCNDLVKIVATLQNYCLELRKCGCSGPLRLRCWIENRWASQMTLADYMGSSYMSGLTALKDQFLAWTPR